MSSKIVKNIINHKNIEKITELEFERNYNIIESEINCITRAFYSQLEVDNFAREGKANYHAINQDAAFWSLYKISLQTTFFIVLGRLLDKEDANLSIYKFLNLHHQHPEFFTKEALRLRKESSGLQEAEVIDKYIQNIIEPTAQDFRSLKQALKVYSAKLATYRNIRHVIYAHNAPLGKAERAELMSHADIVELEELIYFLNDLIKVLWQFFYNGRLPELGLSSKHYIDNIKNDVRKVLNKLL